jgi:hypothetical protein
VGFGSAKRRKAQRRKLCLQATDVVVPRHVWGVMQVKLIVGLQGEVLSEHDGPSATGKEVSCRS